MNTSKTVVLIDRFGMPVSYSKSAFEKLITDRYTSNIAICNIAWTTIINSKFYFRLSDLPTLLAISSHESIPIDNSASALLMIFNRFINNNYSTKERALFSKFIDESIYQCLNSWDLDSEIMRELILHSETRNALLITASDHTKKQIERLYNEEVENLLINHFNDCIKTISENITDKLPIISLIIDASNQAETIQVYLGHYPD